MSARSRVEIRLIDGITIVGLNLCFNRAEGLWRMRGWHFDMIWNRCLFDHKVSNCKDLLTIMTSSESLWNLVCSAAFIRQEMELGYVFLRPASMLYIINFNDESVKHKNCRSYTSRWRIICFLWMRRHLNYLQIMKDWKLKFIQ